MRLRMLVTLVSLLTASTAPLSAASIGLFSTRDCSSCNLTMSSIGTGHVFISVVTQGLPVPEVTGASFKVIGLPSGWLTLSTPSAASVIAAGDPFGSAGAGIGFGLPQIGECVLLHTVLVIRTSMESDVTLRVTQRTPPNNPQFACPVVHFNCGPCFPIVCVSGGELFIDSNRDCTVSVEETTWARVKDLYR